MPNARIMVVEDEWIIAGDIRDSLESMGYKVSVVSTSAEDAVLKARKEQPDLILMDIKLRGEMDGVEAAEKIHKTLRIPIIFLTAFADKEVLQRAKAAEPYGYLIKPFEIRELHSSIEMALHRAKTEKKLREAEERFRVFVDFTYDWEFWLGTDHRFIHVSPSCKRITGYGPEEFMADPELFEKIIHPEDRERHIRLIYDDLEHLGVIEDEYRIVGKSGETRWIALSCQPVLSDKGEWLGIRGSGRDITRRKKAEAELLRAQKSETIATLAGGIAHDFNNLLSLILGYIQLAQMDIASNTSASQALVEAKKAAMSAGDLTQKFITLSRAGEPSKKTTSLKELIERSIEALRSSSGIRFELLLAEDLSQAQIDEDQMAEALGNLLENAAESMPQGGRIRIEAMNDRLRGGEEKKIPSMPDGQYVRIGIKDQGKGIPRKDLPRIFDPYFSTKQRGSQKGMGFGLAIVYSIITKHGGYIHIESEPEVGTTAYVYIPVD